MPQEASIPKTQSPPAAETPDLSNGKGRRRLILWVGIGVLAVIGLAVGIPYYLYLASHESTDDAFIEAHIVMIGPRVAGHVLKVHVRDNQWVEKGDLLVELDPQDFEARLAAEKAVLQAARAREQSARITVDVTKITSGASVDEAAAALKVAESAVETAKSRVASAESKLEQAKAGVVVAQATAEAAKADVTAMEAQAKRDDDDLARNREMFEQKAISQQQLDHAATTATTSRANLAAARKKSAASEAQVPQAQAAAKAAQDAVGEARSQLAEAQSGIVQAQARLAAANAAPQQVALSQSQVHVVSGEIAGAEAAVEQATLALSYTKIHAPVSGRVTRKSVEPGNYVQVGQSLMALVEAKVWVVANYKETQLTYMRPGQPVRIAVDAYPGAEFKGHVDSIAAGTGARFSLLPPENATGNYIKVVQRVPVKIVFDELPDPTQYYLGPGMSVVPVVDVSNHPNAPQGPSAPPVETSTPAAHPVSK